MLIGNKTNRPDLKSVRRIKQVLRSALSLPEDAMVTVTQLACLEEACAPLETVIGLLRPGMPQLQHKVHKPTEAINAKDLEQACSAWGFSVQPSTIEFLIKDD